MASPLSTYAYLNAKLKARISGLLPESFFEQLLHAPSLVEAMQLLQSTNYAIVEQTYTATGDLKMCELRLLEQELGVFLNLHKSTERQVKTFSEALICRYEIDNLKNALRLWFDRNVRKRAIADKVGYLLRQQIFHDLDLDSVIFGPDIAAVASQFADTPFADIIARCLPLLESSKSIFPLEIELDKYFYENLLSSAQVLSNGDQSIVRRLIGVEVDIMNINWIIRLKSLYSLKAEDALRAVIPYGFSLSPGALRDAYGEKSIQDVIKACIGGRYTGLQALLSEETREETSRLLLLERVLERIVLSEIQRVLAGDPFTIGILLAYFILKRLESRHLVTVLNAKYYAITGERVKDIL